MRLSWILNYKSDICLPQQNYESVFTESFYEFPLPLLLFLEPRAKLSSPRWFATNISYVKQDKQRYDVRQIQQTTSQRKNDLLEIPISNKQNKLNALNVLEHNGRNGLKKIF